jgi:uncharacterized protein
MAELASCLYEGAVTHVRLKPFRHALHYKVYSVLLDLDELPHLDTGSIWFGVNRFALMGYDDRDHGARDGTSLRDWAMRYFAEAGVDTNGLKIRLICAPRVLGYVFNPLSILLAYNPDGKLVAVLYEVKNTFGDQHGYLFRINSPEELKNHGTDKCFYVSPFLEMKAQYKFILEPPVDKFSLVIRQSVAEGEILTATWTGKRLAWQPEMLKKFFLRIPLIGIKIMAAIHYHALFVWAIRRLRPRMLLSSTKVRLVLLA